MKIIGKYNQDKKRVFLFLSFLFIAITTNAVTIQKDSLKSKYEISDPRNPNCPCHKYQKMADDEYKNRLKDQSKELGIAISKLDMRNDRMKKKSVFSFIKVKNKRKTKSHPIFKKLFDIKRYSFWKRVTDTNACFKW